MTSNVIGLFDSQSIADQVVEDLLAHGFNRRNINCYEGGREELEHELEREGVVDTEAAYYVEGLDQGGVLVSVRARGSHIDEAVEIMNRYAGTGGTEADEATSASYATTEVGTIEEPSLSVAATDTSRVSPISDAAEARLEVAEEQLRIGKREVQRGGLRVRRIVTEHEVEEQVTLRDETINVDRHVVDRAVESTDGDLFTEQVFEFTETDEEAVVAKETHVVEEVVVGKEVEQRTETVRDTVRRADVEIEQLGSRYGESLVNDERYAGREWHEVETDARAGWERENADGASWDEAKVSVRSAWDKAHGQR